MHILIKNVYFAVTMKPQKHYIHSYDIFYIHFYICYTLKAYVLNCFVYMNLKTRVLFFKNVSVFRQKLACLNDFLKSFKTLISLCRKYRISMVVLEIWFRRNDSLMLIRLYFYLTFVQICNFYLLCKIKIKVNFHCFI